MLAIVIVVVLVIVAVVAVVVVRAKSSSSDEDDTVIRSADRLAAFDAGRGSAPSDEQAPRVEPEPAPEPAPAPELEFAPLASAEAVEEELDEPVDDEPDLSRFGVASPTTKTAVEIPWPSPAGTPTGVRHLEEVDAGDELVSLAEPEPEPEPVGVIDLTEADAPVAADEPADEPAGEQVAAAAHVSSEDGPDPLSSEEDGSAAPVASGSAESEPVPEPDSGPELAPEDEDPVDLVVSALINRARERQVGVAQVAAELVEQADLEDREVDEVLMDLVDRGDLSSSSGSSVSPTSRRKGTRDGELTMFNDAVPRRPGQLTQFSELAGSEKKRVIIRVLCLLVTVAEDSEKLKREQQEADEAAADGTPTAEAGDSKADGDAAKASPSWPLARAVWPGAKKPKHDEPSEPILPARR